MEKVLYIITGTTSGLGKELQKIFIKNNVNYIAINRTVADLSKIPEVEKALEDLKANIQKKYNDHKVVFVNNASTLGEVLPLNLCKSEDLISTINVNFVTPLLFFNALSSTGNKWGLFNITSGASKTQNKYLGLYSTTKLAVENFVKFINMESEQNNCFATYNYDPGLVDTNMHTRLKTNKYFKNKKIEKVVPKDAIMVATEIWSLLKTMIEVNNDKGVD